MQTTLTRIFIVLESVCPKIETKFLGKLRNSKVFSAQNQVVSKTKKKEKKKVFTEIETDFSAEIVRFRLVGGCISPIPPLNPPLFMSRVKNNQSSHFFHIMLINYRLST